MRWFHKVVISASSLDGAGDGLLVARHADSVCLVVGAGATPRRDGLQLAQPGVAVDGIERPNVHASRDVLCGEAPSAGRVLVVDELGHYEAAGVAEFLLDRAPVWLDDTLN